MPKAQIASPTNGTAFPLPANFEIVARTIDIAGAVVNVSFFEGTNLLAKATNAPFQMAYLDVQAGSHQLSLQSTDEHGLVTTSEPIEVRVEPANDNFVQRILISNTFSTFVTDNSGATSEVEEILPDGATRRTLWWTWTAPSNGIVTLATSPISAASKAAKPNPKAQETSFQNDANTNSVPSPSLVIIGPGNDIPPGPTTGPLINFYTGTALTNLNLCASNSVWFIPWWGSGRWCVLASISFPAVGGQTYQLAVDGLNGSFGSATIAFSFAPPPVAPIPPANDNFGQATLLSGSSIAIAGTTANATSELGEPGVDLATRTVWYSWTAAASGSVQVKASANSLNDLNVAVYAGSSVWNLTSVANGNNQVSFFALAGTTYKILVGGPNGLATDFSLALNGPPQPPTISAARLSNGNYRLGISGIVGQSFVVQSSMNSLNWVTIRTDTLLGNSLNFIDATASGLPQRFYRVLSLDAVFNYQPFALLTPSIQPDARFTLHLSGMAGQPFRIQTSTNFLDWSDLTGGVLVGERFDFIDLEAHQFKSRFYRALKQ